MGITVTYLNLFKGNLIYICYLLNEKRYNGTTTGTIKQSFQTPTQTPTIAKLQRKEEDDRAEKKNDFTLRSPSDFLPMIKRGFTNMIDDEEESIVSMGWKVEVTSRKEREEALR